MTTRAPVLATAAAVAAAALAWNAAGGTPEEAHAAADLEAFASCAAVVRYGESHARRLSASGGNPMAAVGGGTEDAAAGGESRAAAPASSAAFSTTNVQETGIDEPDVAKTDGARLYTVARGRLQAVDVSGERPRVLGALDLPGEAWDHQLLLRGSTVLVVWSAWGPEDHAGRTIVAEVDAADPAAMRVTRRLTVDGTFVTARMADAAVRVVTRSTPEAIALPEGAERRSRPSAWLPAIELRDRVRGTRDRRSVPCDDVHHAPVFAGLATVTVLTLDLSDGLELTDTDTVMTDAETVYASAGALYVATTRWMQPGRRSLPRRITSAVHRFDTAQPTATAYTGSGVVPGYLLDQFSMSEHEGVLRVATTSMPAWWGGGEDEPDSESFVTTLRPDPATGDLAELGSIGGLGRGERIYAVRFMGDVGYVVTFRETDPLYTLDLSDPAAPAVLGELKIRGYSAYLHPAGDDLLIGVGQDATRRGRRLGTQVSLFDVSDLRNPRRLAQRSLGAGTGSDVEYDHHAFLWWAPTGLAVVPVMSWDRRTGEPHSAAVGLRVDRSGIAEVGRAQPPSGNQDMGVRRSLVVGGRLLTVTERGVLSSALDTLAPQAWLRF